MASKLIDALPEFALELESLLRAEGHDALAEQISTLPLAARCRCSDTFCASFYTAPPPKGAYGPGHRCLMLNPDDGMIVLDLVQDRICQVEVLDRPDVRQALIE